MMTPERSGLLAGGNFIVDQLKLVDHYPEQDRLAFVSSQSRTNGGGPYNVLKDLAAMAAPFPLAAIGMVGDDENGRWIRDDLRECGIDTGQLHVTIEAATSYTDVFSVESTGRRTFFHQPGANALLEPAHFDFSNSSAKLFHDADLMLLDRLDHFDASGSTAAASVVFEPFESIITETRTGPKNVFWTLAATASPAATSLPPTKIAVDARSSPPRVNIAPCTSGTAASGVTLPCRRSTSAPASTATTESNVLGCGSPSSWIRIFLAIVTPPTRTPATRAGVAIDISSQKPPARSF
jgi:hypothetical protein